MRRAHTTLEGTPPELANTRRSTKSLNRALSIQTENTFNWKRFSGTLKCRGRTRAASRVVNREFRIERTASTANDALVESNVSEVL